MAVSLSINHLTKRFGKIVAVDDVTLRIEPGELFFLLGPSGCGKTTLLRSIAGFHDPDSGSLSIGDKEVTNLPPHRRDAGMVFQSYALWPHMSVAENVAFGLQMRKVAAADRQSRVTDALAMVQMGDRADARINELSGGQQQRVALARALVIEPRCLLLDEPLSNLDAKLRLEMRAEIRRICKQAGLTAVYVTHDQAEALSVSDRLAVMCDGKLMQVGSPIEVYRRPTSSFVARFIGETNLLVATAKTPSNGITSFETPIGALQAEGEYKAGDRMTLSVRPEAIRLSTPPPDVMNVMAGRLSDTVFLGQTAQHLLWIDDTALKVTEVNPRYADKGSRPVTFWIPPADIAVLHS